ncbi:MAG: twin-arginine translocase subunit TatC [Desulfobacteraceae bacterium]|jgi:sec-independent protein translocase protein TatC|nr:twin-arginine translocase subunit TatC [Desulfobacteraceae bacterium]
MLEVEDKVPFTEHLEELRHRLIVCFVAVGIGFAACYAFKERLFNLLAAPLISAMQAGDKLVFTGLPEAFFTYLKIAFLAGCVLASPVIIYQFWMFVAPGLYGKERRVLAPIVGLSILFFIGGGMFGYLVVFPLGFQFFLSFATETIRPLPAMKEYLGFATKLLIAFGLAFELPLVITFMARLGLVSVAFLKKNRRYAILIFFIAAAILTPPDVVSQILMALPLMLLYELSIVGARIFGRKPPDDPDPAR